MTTDNRTNEQIVAEAMASRSNGGPSTWFKEADLAVAALKAAGRLAGEPTPEQVEAAAKTLADRDGYSWEHIPQQGYLDEARAALVAAAGAAPQAESATGRAELIADVDAAKVRPALFDIPHLLFRVRDALASPVQPSSTVDVMEIAEVIRPLLAGFTTPSGATAEGIARAVVEAIGGDSGD